MVGSIVERKSGGPTPPKPPKLNGSGATGFPTAKHRSQSAFARARNEAKQTNGTSRPQQIPVVEPSRGPPGQPTQADTEGDWRRQMEEENQKKVESMTDEEREQEKREIFERFGPNIVEVLRKAREAREARETPSTEAPQKENLSIDTSLKSPATEKRVMKSTSTCVFQYLLLRTDANVLQVLWPHDQPVLLQAPPQVLVHPVEPIADFVLRN